MEGLWNTRPLAMHAAAGLRLLSDNEGIKQAHLDLSPHKSSPRLTASHTHAHILAPCFTHRKRQMHTHMQTHTDTGRGTEAWNMEADPELLLYQCHVHLLSHPYFPSGFSTSNQIKVLFYILYICIYIYIYIYINNYVSYTVQEVHVMPNTAQTVLLLFEQIYYPELCLCQL